MSMRSPELHMSVSSMTSSAVYPVAYPVEPAAKENGQQQSHLARRNSLPQPAELLFGRRLTLNNDEGPVRSLGLVGR